MTDVQAWLRERHGPLPGWGWLVVGGVAAAGAYYMLKHRGSGSTTVIQQPTAPTDLSGLGGIGGGGSLGGTGTGTGAGTGTGTGSGTDAGNTPVVHTPVGVINLGDNPTPVQAPGQVQPYIPGTPPGTSPNWVPVPAGATPNPRDVITTPDGVRWMLKAAGAQNVLNGSGGYGPVAVSQQAQAWVNTMRLAGHDDIVPMSYLDPNVGFGGAGDAVLSVPGSPGWEYEQGLARAFQQGLGAGLSPQAAAQGAGVGYLPTGTLPDYVNTPQYTQMEFSLPPSAGGLAGIATPQQYGLSVGGAPQPAPAAPSAPVFAPLTNGGQPVYTNANPNPNPAPYPPPAPPPIPAAAAPEPSYSGFNYTAPIGLSFGGVA